MDLNQKVWAPDPEAGFVLGVVADIGADSITVTPLRNGSTRKGAASKPITAPYDRVFPAEDDDDNESANAKTVEDNCALMYLNEATLLNNVRRRYAKDEIYTYVANILVALNPYKPLRQLYDAKVSGRVFSRHLSWICVSMAGVLHLPSQACNLPSGLQSVLSGLQSALTRRSKA